MDAARTWPQWLVGGFILLVVLSAGCAGGEGPTEGGKGPEKPGGDPPPSTAPAATVELGVASGNLARGQRFKLSVIVKDSGQRVLSGRSVTFTSTDTAVLTVGSDSVATGISSGTAVVTATVDGKSATATFTVISFVQIAAGEEETCAITDEGVLYCAGGRYGGPGAQAQRVAPTLRFSQVRIGHHTLCALTTGNRPYCWGRNESGSAGTGDFGAHAEPAAVAGGHNFTSIAPMSEHTCALTPEGAAYCWGRNDLGQLGDGSTNDSAVPVAVAREQTFTAITTAQYSSCAITGDGVAYCWGRNELGELGVGGSRGAGDRRLVPAAVAGGLRFARISASTTHACGVTTARKLYCWGNNRVGAVGAPTHETCINQHECSTAPIAVAPERDFELVEAAANSACAIDSGQSVWCWGLDMGGKLGPNAPPACGVAGTNVGCSKTPFRAFDAGFVSLSGGWRHQCGVKSDGTAYCWGDNSKGQITAAAESVPEPYVFSPVLEPGR